MPQMINSDGVAIGVNKAWIVSSPMNNTYRRKDIAVRTRIHKERSKAVLFGGLARLCAFII